MGNFKTFPKEMLTYAVVIDSKTPYCSPRLIYISSTIPVKIPASFFCRNCQAYFKVNMET